VPALTKGDLTEARKLQEEAHDVSRRILGQDHPATSRCAWNLLTSLHAANETATVQAVIARDLAWLLDRDPATLGDVQAEIASMSRQNSALNGSSEYVAGNFCWHLSRHYHFHSPMVLRPGLLHDTLPNYPGRCLRGS
jgi:hypothetical protein